jgi:hypothetical protein
VRWLRALPAIALLALAFPASALAHTPAGTVGCTGADFTFTAFAAGSNTVNYRVTVDGATFRQSTFTLPGDGTSGALNVPYTLPDDQPHAVQAFAWWGPDGVQDRHTRPESSPALDTRTLQCPIPVTPPATPPTTGGPPASPPSPPAPPAATTTVTPAAVPAPVQTPVSSVAGTQARSAAARLAVPRSCASRTVRVRVTGRQIRRVTVLVNGRRARTVAVRANQRTVTVAVPVRRSGAARQRIQARVTFRNGAAARTLTASATRCAQAAVRPQFTG